MAAENIHLTLQEIQPDEVAIECTENITQRIVIQRSISGDASIGARSLITNNSNWLVNQKIKIPYFNNCLFCLDEFVATPSFNVSVIESAYDKDFKFFDAIYESKYVGLIDGIFAGLGLFALSIGIYVIKYCKLREKERNSNYFYFSRLFKAYDEKKIKAKIGQIEQDIDDTNGPITYEYLQAAAYFYPPDISKIACWRRRFFAAGKERKQLTALNKFLQKNSKKKTLNKLHKKITEQVCLFLNREANFHNFHFQMEWHKNNWTIGFSDNYKSKFFVQIQPLIKDNLENTLKENSDRKSKNLILPILTALGQTSFIYWVLIFIFYFIPMAPIVTSASISVIPLAIALLVALPTLLIRKIRKSYRAYNTYQNITPEYIETENREMIEKTIIELNKQSFFLECCKKNNPKFSTIPLRFSPLLENLLIVLKKHRFSNYHVLFRGFLEGCFLPFFVGWLFLDGFKVIFTYAVCPAMTITSFTPIGPLITSIIAGITLLAGIGYGRYSANKAYQAHEVRFNDLQAKITALRDDPADNLVLDKSLRGYDRLLRRFSDEQPAWTSIKKTLNRSVVLIKRLGTGSLVFRLVIWGPIFAIITAVTTINSFVLSTVLITGTTLSAIVIAAWCLYSYNLESNITQAERVTDYLVQTARLFHIDKALSEAVENPYPSILRTSCTIATKANTNKKILEPLSSLPERNKHIVPKNIILQKKTSSEYINLNMFPRKTNIKKEILNESKSNIFYATI